MDPLNGFLESMSAVFGLFMNALLNTFIEFWKQRIVCCLIFLFLKKLMQYEQQRREFFTSVFREGAVWRIPAEDTMVGDIVLLHKGDRVPADGVYIDGHDLWCDESELLETDEYVPKSVDGAPFVFGGSKIVSGHGRIIVTAVGYGTAYMFSMDNVFAPEYLTPFYAKIRDFCSSASKRLIQFVIVLPFLYALLRFISRTGFGTNVTWNVVESWLVLDINFSILYLLTLLYLCLPHGLPSFCIFILCVLCK